MALKDLFPTVPVNKQGSTYYEYNRGLFEPTRKKYWRKIRSRIVGKRLRLGHWITGNSCHDSDEWYN